MSLYNLLVVDDEEIAIRGIVEGIDWSMLPIQNIYKAYDAEEARQIFARHPVHILISDIDMPNENGIELLAWVNEHSPDTATLFLTGHADFLYAQQAIQLSSFNYLLKPIDHDLLRDSVGKAIESIRAQAQKDSLRKTYEVYNEQWNRQLPLLIERLWQEVLNMRIPAAAAKLEPLFALYSMPLDMDKSILPVLISIEEWKQEWNARDEEIMTYALKNAAADILLKDRPGNMISDQNGLIFALLYDPVEDEMAELPLRCEEYIRKCSEYLYGVVSCYIGEPVKAGELRACSQLLAEMERCNVGQTGAVLRLDAFKKPKSQTLMAPNFHDWAILIEQGKKDELKQKVVELFERLKHEQVDQNYMAGFYYGLVAAVFQLLQKRLATPTEVYLHDEWKNGEPEHVTLAGMKVWTLLFVDTAADYLVSQGGEVSLTIAKVRQFIGDNLHKDMNREMIADHVYLNPAYLSRLFRKETGQSLTDFIVDLRLTKAKKELEKTNIKISDISLSVGYTNFSHFSKLFKKATGLSPQEYRKKYQDVR
ncbi:response regulator transcription factor [Paenibacillus nasutitermitis]|uniref:DNA-binding response regulator n=1 Tax=Paenibacillus nasutitermitis TaxID=1652958 RepID=A0A916ZKF3_9BACL|nr:helix-turn-helix domain-containing protein [Paenibacillus nasutitermitis]GGE01496.1 DNA-binding response regulator [Paenibacillus nasutitermitis]